MEYKIALIPGDGIGPEIVAEAKKVLDKAQPVKIIFRWQTGRGNALVKTANYPKIKKNTIISYIFNKITCNNSENNVKYVQTMNYIQDNNCFLTCL